MTVKELRDLLNNLSPEHDNKPVVYTDPDTGIYGYTISHIATDCVSFEGEIVNLKQWDIVDSTSAVDVILLEEGKRV